MNTINKTLKRLSIFGLIFSFMSILAISIMTYSNKDFVIDMITIDQTYSISRLITQSSLVYQIVVPMFIILSSMLHMCTELLYFIQSDRWMIDIIYMILTSLTSISQVFIMSITLDESHVFHTIFAAIYFINLIVVLILNTSLYVYRRLMNPNFKFIRLLILLFKVLFLGLVLGTSYAFLVSSSKLGVFVFEFIIVSLATLFMAINSLQLYDMDDYIVVKALPSTKLQ